MDTLWFCLIAFSLTAYVVLDGFDLGAGMVHLFVARKEKVKHADAEIEAVEDDVANDHYGDQPEPDETHHVETSV